MLLTLRTTHVPATDLGFLPHKHPDRVGGGHVGAVVDVVDRPVPGTALGGRCERLPTRMGIFSR
jgi:hypothetical protein